MSESAVGACVPSAALQPFGRPMTDIESGWAWIDYVETFGPMDPADRPDPIPPPPFDDLDAAIRDGGGLPEITALYLLELLKAAKP